MADSVSMTPPKERQRTGPAIPRPKQKEHLTIIGVDQEQHTIRLNVDGFPVTLTCSPQNNAKTYQQVKAVLLNVVATGINTIT